jgi:FOG: TPR repeat, SEL1 subfamily
MNIKRHKTATAAFCAFFCALQSNAITYPDEIRTSDYRDKKSAEKISELEAESKDAGGRNQGRALFALGAICHAGTSKDSRKFVDDLACLPSSFKGAHYYVNSILGGNVYAKEKDADKAKDFYQKAIQCDVPEANFALGCLMLSDVESENESDFKKAFALFEKAANDGVPPAQFYVGLKRMDEKKHSEAVAWFHTAAKQGYADALIELGRMYLFGESGVDTNVKEAESLLQKVDGANLEARVLLAIAHCIIANNEDEEERAVRELTAASEKLDEDAFLYWFSMKLSAEYSNDIKHYETAVERYAKHVRRQLENGSRDASMIMCLEQNTLPPDSMDGRAKRKFLFASQRDLEDAENVRFFSRDSKKKPSAGTIYSRSEAYPNTWYALDIWEDRILEEKKREFFKICESLGATYVKFCVDEKSMRRAQELNKKNDGGGVDASVTLSASAGGFGQTKSYGGGASGNWYREDEANTEKYESLSSNIEISQAFDANMTRKLPENLVFFENESTWQILHDQATAPRQRLKTFLAEISIETKDSNSKHFLDKIEAEIRGSYGREVNTPSGLSAGLSVSASANYNRMRESFNKVETMKGKKILVYVSFEENPKIITE